MDRDFKGVWIPKEIWLNEELGWSEKLLLVEINSLAKNGECFATNEYLAKFLGVSKDRISKLLTALNRKGLLRIELIYKTGTKVIEKRIITPLGIYADTSRRNHLYPLGESTDTPIGENAEDNSFIINTNDINTIINTSNKKINKKSNSAELENEFELLWKMYPRKMGKAAALKSYIKARKIKKTPYETIENGLYRYNNYLKSQGTEEQYIMHGSTWFNQAKWLDEYSCIAPQKKVSSFFDYYKAEFGGEENGFSEHSEIIEYDSTYLP